MGVLADRVRRRGHAPARTPAETGRVVVEEPPRKRDSCRRPVGPGGQAALGRFGTLTGLSLIHSSPTDAYPNSPTLSFATASYTSKYLAFVPVEWYGEAADPSTPTGYVYLQQPTAQQKALFTRYGGSSPFIDIGNRYILSQAQYLPSALAGLSWTQVVAAMRDPSSAIARDIDGAANITAAICSLTRGQPGGVCHSAGVQAASSI